MTEEKKLKVVWLCYFTNHFVQDKIRARKRVGEIAPWISNMIPLFENDSDVELHIISQHRWTRGYQTFMHNGVQYHFFNAGIPYTGRHWPAFFRFDLFNDFLLTKRSIKKIVHKIDPHLIHLHGTENEFSTAITQFHLKYPVFITIQGFIHQTSSASKIIKRRIQNEYRILRLFRHYGYRTETMGKVIRSINPDSILHWHAYPNKPVITVNVNKKFDLVFFARICEDKGIVDLLHAVSIVKKDYPDISLCVIGGGNSEPFEKLSFELGLEKNIFWAGFLPSQDDVHQLASQCRISVLPTYHDIISGTIIESLFLKIPVVAYNVGSIHEVNANEEIISLVEKQNIEKLAESIIFMLNHPEICLQRAEKGYLRVKEMFGQTNSEIRDNILKAYSEVIKDFN